MVDIVKHVFKYAELRRTLYLNLANKDDLGRHRGNVLYGMKIVPTSSNIITIGSGALYTPFGTKLFFDVEDPTDPSVNTIDLTEFMNPVTRPKPMVLGIYMKFANDASQSASLEASSDLNSVSFDLVARVVAWSRETGNPVMTLSPLNPVTMGAGEVQPNSYSHIDTSDRAAVVDVAQPTGVYEIPIGHIIVGGYSDIHGAEQSPTAIYDVAGIGHWAAGVTCVQLSNPWENLADFLGFDPLLGRTDATSAPDPEDTNFTALSQSPGSYPLGDTTMPSLAHPKLGSAVPAEANDPWDVDWSLYRLPSFFRDGEQLLGNLRRLDYMLRLWMNRTGAQGLIGIIQDGTLGSKQAPLAAILDAFQNGTSSNLNEIIFSDSVTALTERHASVAAQNLTLKSGFIEHLPHTVEATRVSEFGDSHEVALTALNRAISHILTDVLGKSFDREILRLPSSTAWSTLLSPPSGLNWTDKVNRPTPYQNGGTLLSPYLTAEALYAAVEVIAARALHGAAANLLVNPNFLDDSVVGAGTVYGWTLVGGGSVARTPTSVADTPLRFAVATVPIASEGEFKQIIDYTLVEGGLRSLLLGAPVLSACATIKVLSGSVRLQVRAKEGATIRVASTSVAYGVSTEPQNASFSFGVSAIPAGTQTIEVAIMADGGAAVVDIYGVHFGAGVPVSDPVNRDSANFLPLGAGKAYPLRNDLYGGGHRAAGFADAILAQDLTTKSQLDAEALTRSNADIAEAGTRLGNDNIEHDARVAADAQEVLDRNAAIHVEELARIAGDAAVTALIPTAVLDGTVYLDLGLVNVGTSIRLKLTDGSFRFIPSSTDAIGPCHSNCHSNCHGDCCNSKVCW